MSGGLVLPAQYEFVIVLIKVPGQRDEIDLNLLQIVFTANNFLYGFELDDQAVGGINFYKAL